MLALGFVVGIGLGVLFFELFSIKHPKTLEEVEMMLEKLNKRKRAIVEDKVSPGAYHWQN